MSSGHASAADIRTADTNRCGYTSGTEASAMHSRRRHSSSAHLSGEHLCKNTQARRTHSLTQEHTHRASTGQGSTRLGVRGSRISCSGFESVLILRSSARSLSMCGVEKHRESSQRKGQAYRERKQRRVRSGSPSGTAGQPQTCGFDAQRRSGADGGRAEDGRLRRCHA